MAPDFADIHDDCEQLYSLAGFEPDQLISMYDLVCRLLANPPRAVVGLATESELVKMCGYWVVRWRRSMPAPRARWRVAHELAEWWYRHQQEDDIELRCNALGAALVAPPIVVRRAVMMVGYDPIQLAARLRTTQSLALLRIGEVILLPTILLRRGKPELFRGDPCVWDAASPWMQTVRINDEPNRSGVMVDPVWWATQQ